jgi:hypothetical protein
MAIRGQAVPEDLAVRVDLPDLAGQVEVARAAAVREAAELEAHVEAAGAGAARKLDSKELPRCGVRNA